MQRPWDQDQDHWASQNKDDDNQDPQRSVLFEAWLAFGAWRSNQDAIQDPKSQSAAYQELPWPSKLLWFQRPSKNKFKSPIKKFGNNSEGKIWFEVYFLLKIGTSQSTHF